jgi:3-(3-hydroxy-phenyl)propionate hydroxylase
MQKQTNDRIYDVIIVGAGPVGLSLGIYLAKMGFSLLVLEKNHSTAEHSRAPSVWPKTQEVLAQLGVIDAFLKGAIQVPEMKIWDADNDRIIFKAPFFELKAITPYPLLLIIPQSNIEKILLRELQEHTLAEIRFLSEVTAVSQSEKDVTVTYSENAVEKQAFARIVAGADGAHSTVRDNLNASFSGKTYPVKAALADVILHNIPDNYPFRISTKDVPAIGIRMKGEVWRIILPVMGRKAVSLSERVEQAVKNLFGRCEWEPVWESDFSIHNKISSSFSEGRVVLAGDAAHLNSPVGGQGMNAGIQDISRLGKAIAESLESGNSSPLCIYSEKRRREIRKGVNKFTDALTQVMLVYGKGKLIKPVFRIARFLMRFKPIRIQFLKRMTMLS